MLKCIILIKQFLNILFLCFYITYMLVIKSGFIMKKIYAPWRSQYITKLNNGTCVFCEQFQSSDDEKYLILKRYEHCIVMLNLHPYNAGHIMVLPLQHAAQLSELSPMIRSEIMEVVSESIEKIKTALACDGVNMGMNIGKAAGGSIPQHLHIHILPRWFGDTNFLATLADTKPISFNIHEIYKKLKEFF